MWFILNSNRSDFADMITARKILAMVTADSAYQNIMKNKDKKTAWVEHDATFQCVMIDFLAYHTNLFKQFSYNPS